MDTFNEQWIQIYRFCNYFDALKDVEFMVKEPSVHVEHPLKFIRKCHN